MAKNDPAWWAEGHRPPGTLLAVDLGLKTGFAWIDEAGDVVRYRSTRFPDRGTLRRAVPGIVRERADVTVIVVEGDVALARPWASAARRMGAAFQEVGADVWRADLFPAHERTSGTVAKATADRFARRALELGPTSRPTSLRHDVAEAICLGIWAAWQRGWVASERQRALGIGRG